jgi:ATP-dependent RNA helicase SUPV3L1/SUV3
VTIGRRYVFLPALLEPRAVVRRIALCTALFQKRLMTGAPTDIKASFATRRGVDGKLYRALGYPAFGPLAIRADLVERIDAHLFELAQSGPFDAPDEVTEWLSCSSDELGLVILALGYHQTEDGYIRPRKPRRRQRRRRRKRD